VRARLHAEWQRVAAAYYGDEAQLLTRTPGELLRDVETQKLHPPVAAGAELKQLRRLTALVERGYYSQRVCGEEMLAEATQLAAALVSHSPEGGSAALPSVPAALRDLRGSGAPRPLG